MTQAAAGTDGRFADRLERAVTAGEAAADFEAAASELTALAHDALGDHEAATRPGALLAGERDYRVSGIFLITPDREFNMLVANRGFPREQRRLAIPIEWNHPGEVVRTERAILLENTDEHGQFRQFLKTSRMGSSMYVPLFADGAMFGQIVAAAQARWTYAAADLERLRRIAASVEPLWTRFDGPDWLARDYPAEDLWDAGARAVNG